MIGAVIGVLAGLVFSQALVQILDWNWETIAMINLATIFFVSGVLIHFVIFVLCILLLPEKSDDDNEFSFYIIIGVPGVIPTLLFFSLMNYFFDIFSGIVKTTEEMIFGLFMLSIFGTIMNFLAFGILGALKRGHPLIPSLTWALFPLIFLTWASVEHVYAKYPFIATILIPILLISAITGYYIAKALHPSVENLIKKREEKKKEFEREKREIIEELEKLIGDQDEKR